MSAQDVFTARPEVRYRATLAARQVRNQLVHGLFGLKRGSSGLWAGFFYWHVILMKKNRMQVEFYFSACLDWTISFDCS